MEMETEVADGGMSFRQIQIQRRPRPGKYGLIHPDGTPCDALKPENCPKMMGGGEECSAEERDDASGDTAVGRGGRELADWEDLTEEQRRTRVSNAKQYLKMVEGGGREAYNARKLAEARRRLETETAEERAERLRKNNERRRPFREETNARQREARANMSDGERAEFAGKKRLYNEIQRMKRDGEMTPEKERRISEIKAYLKGLRKPTHPVRPADGVSA